MSTETPILGHPPVPVATPLAIREVIELLIKHYGLHEGKYDLLLEYQFGAGAFGPTPETVNPGVMIGIAKLGLTRAEKVGPLTVDAGTVNPLVTTKGAKKPQRAKSDA
jgi:hypothetical protein